MVALLVDRGVRLADIWDMNREQVQAFYLCERDEAGNVLIRPKSPERSREDDLRTLFRRRGYPEHRVESEIRAHLMGEG